VPDGFHSWMSVQIESKQGFSAFDNGEFCLLVAFLLLDCFPEPIVVDDWFEEFVCSWPCNGTRNSAVASRASRDFLEDWATSACNSSAIKSASAFFLFLSKRSIEKLTFCIFGRKPKRETKSMSITSNFHPIAKSKTYRHTASKGSADIHCSATCVDDMPAFH